MMAGAAFDRLAERYDTVWTASGAGRRQRDAVWSRIDPLFQPGDSILDLGCGTGEDALHLMASGIEVCAVDASARMVQVARARGVNARQLSIENLDELTGRFDGAISNFGALNCIARLESVGSALGRLLRSGGALAICVMGRFCLWETCYYLHCLRPDRAFRRWRPGGCKSSIGVHVRYPSVRRLARAFGRQFCLADWYGIGLCVPPSYAGGLSETALERFDAIDRRLAHRTGLRALCDHRLLVFRRI